MLRNTCHSGPDPESQSATLYFGMLNQVQHDGLKSLHVTAPFCFANIFYLQ